MSNTIERASIEHITITCRARLPGHVHRLPDDADLLKRRETDYIAHVELDIAREPRNATVQRTIREDVGRQPEAGVAVVTPHDHDTRARQRDLRCKRRSGTRRRTGVEPHVGWQPAATAVDRTVEVDVEVAAIALVRPRHRNGVPCDRNRRSSGCGRAGRSTSINAKVGMTLSRQGCGSQENHDKLARTHVASIGEYEPFE
ncbi:MAG: hypothetical protein NXI31_17470 [bacterium]|nr:hypothetical protein [bacterium]